MISVIVPVRNERKIIRNSIEKLDDYLRSNFKKYEIIVFDDNSTDGTSDILKRIKCKNLFLIQSNRRVGKGKSIEISTKKAKFKKVIFIDADLKGLESIKKIYDKLDDCEIVIGNRYSKLSKVKRESKRLIVSKVFNLLVKILLGSKFDDHQCGLKGFRKSRKLLNLFDQIKSTHFFWDTEFIVRAQWNKFSICEVPVVWKEGKHSHVNILRDSTLMIRDLMRLFFERIRLL